MTINNSFHRALAAWFTLAITVVLGVATLVYFSFTQSVALDAWVLHTRDVIDMVDDVSIVVSDIESGSRGYVITGNTAFLEPYGIAKARIGQLTEKLENTVHDNPIQIKRTQQLRVKLLERADFAESLITLHDKSGFDQARDLIAAGHGMKITDGIRALSSEMKAEEGRLLVERTQRVAAARNRALTLGAGGVLLIFVVIGLVFRLVLREGILRLRAETELSTANQRLLSSLQQAEGLMQEKRMIDHLAALLHSCSTLEEAREVISKEVRHSLPDMRGAVYLYRSSHNLVEVISQWNEPHALKDRKSFSPEECWALKSGSQHVMRTRDDVACSHVNTDATEATDCVPMNVHGQTIGLMYIEGTADQFDEDRLDLIRRFSDQIGMSLATLQLEQQLREQSLHDPLTGLYNRRYFEAAIEKEVARADRHEQTIGFMMIDIDHFKAINDQYGHQAGDLILKGVSDTLGRHTRTEDIACRYGGEEFLLVIPGASLNATYERAETLRQAVEKVITVLSDGTAVSNTRVSLGVAVYPTHGPNWQDVVRVADQALYRAKDQGRNRVVVADSTPVTTTKAT